jgi:antitoxin VapB
MAFHIKNPETDALARQVARIKNDGLREAVYIALHELERENKKLSLIELSAAFAQALRAEGKPDLGKPADKEFIDSLYQRD